VSSVALAINAADLFQCRGVLLVASLERLQIPLRDNASAGLAEMRVADDGDTNVLKNVGQ
jgi:hypothetical protein